MSTLIRFAESAPERPAVIFGNGETVVTYAQLEQRSRRLAHALRALGLAPGDGIAALLGNDDEFFDVFWAAMRSGLLLHAGQLAPAGAGDAVHPAHLASRRHRGFPPLHRRARRDRRRRAARRADRGRAVV